MGGAHGRANSVVDWTKGMTMTAEESVGDTRHFDYGAARFLAQQDRPAHLVDVGMAELRPELRILLVHDGTLTTALEACQLGPVGVDVRSQDDIQLDETRARHLRTSRGGDAVSRSVDIRDRLTSRLLVQAQSLLLPNRLPHAFPAMLAASDKGLGAALERLELECRRELLWYGRESPANVAMSDRGIIERDTVVRCYRVIFSGRPVLLIEESFSIY